MLEAGKQSPDLSYVTAEGETKNIVSDGEKTWVVFFPFAFSGTCTSEICDMRDNSEKYSEPGLNYVFITCDASHSQKAWAAELGYKGAWISDFYPHGEISKKFGVFNEELGCSNRVSFLVSETGQIEKVLDSESIGAPRDPSQYKS
jgi:peroxiredoxin